MEDVMRNKLAATTARTTTCKTAATADTHHVFDDVSRHTGPSFPESRDAPCFSHQVVG